MKLWQKDQQTDLQVEQFTVGNDRNMDLHLAAFDVLGSLAHIRMLNHVGLLANEELLQLDKALKEIYTLIENGNFSIEEGVEDIHSQIELLLTRSLGDTGKKIHSARSRNDQVLLDMKLFLRHEIENITHDTEDLFSVLMHQSDTYRNDLLPGYTHLQPAMPSSFGLWFSAYAESLTDDLLVLKAAWDITNKNPLGSAAGYGSSFPINRRLTTELLGFSDLNYNVVYAQMGRGKAERIVASALMNIAATLSKLSMDVCLYMNPNFGFIAFPESLTTGSSIMPHKKNPDVFELIRARCNRIQALPNEIALLTTNLPSGYHRDLQMLKEILIPAIQELKNCIQMTTWMLQQIKITKNLLEDEQYKFLFSVEEVNKLVLQGVPFRDAYKQIGKAIESGNFAHEGHLQHTHEGSIGNLCLPEIKRMMEDVVHSFSFEQVTRSLQKLLQETPVIS